MLFEFLCWFVALSFGASTLSLSLIGMQGFVTWIPFVTLFSVLLGYIFGVVLAILVIWFFGLFIKKNHPQNKFSKYSNFWLCQALWYINYHSLMKLTFIGKEKVPTNQRFLLVGNHRSNFDSLIISEKLKKYDIAFITKPSNMKIPFAKPFLRGCCYMPIYRDDFMQSLSVMKDSINRISNNEMSVGVFPEGKRQQEKVLGEFHEGCFNIALKSGCPLVVASIKGSDDIHKNFPWKRTKVRIEILGVLTNDMIQGKTAKAVSDMVRDLLIENLSK